MKQKLLILSITVFLCSTSIFQGQESLDYKIVEFYDSTTDDYTLTTKEEYTYDTNGRLSKVELYYWNSIAWDLRIYLQFQWLFNPRHICPMEFIQPTMGKQI